VPARTPVRQVASAPRRSSAPAGGWWVAIAGAIVAASAVGTLRAEAADTVKAGVILSIEGIFSSIGVPERQGIELAVEQINAAGGVGGKQIELVVYDDGGDQVIADQCLVMIQLTVWRLGRGPAP